MTYECGELPRGSSWVRFNIRFYLIALFFIIFDVELVFMLPWAVVFKDMLAEIGDWMDEMPGYFGTGDQRTLLVRYLHELGNPEPAADQDERSTS